MIKIIIYILLVIFLLIIKIKLNPVLCEDDLLKHIMEDLRVLLEEELDFLIKQEDFKYIHRSKFYENIVLNKEFINKFIQNLDLMQLIKDNINQDLPFIKDEIINRFFIYITEEQRKYEKEFLKNIFVIFYVKSPIYIEQYNNFIAHLDNNAEIKITTPGFMQHLKEFQNDNIQKFIKQGFIFNISLESGYVVISMSWYSLLLFKKFILL